MGQLTLELVHLGTRGDEQWQALQTQGTPWAQARGSQVQARGWGQVRAEVRRGASPWGLRHHGI